MGTTGLRPSSRHSDLASLLRPPAIQLDPLAQHIALAPEKVPPGALVFGAHDDASATIMI